MKLRFLSVLICLLVIFSISASAVTVPESFIVFESEERGVSVSTLDYIDSENGLIYGNTEEDFKKYMSDHNMVLYGSDNKKGIVFNITCATTPFSSKVIDFTPLDEDSIKQYSTELVDDYEAIVEINGTKFIKTVNKVKNEKSTNTSVQFITVKNGMLYVLSFTAAGATLNTENAERINEISTYLTILTNSEKTANITTILTVALLVVLTLVVIGTIIITVFSIIKVWKKPEEDFEA